MRTAPALLTQVCTNEHEFPCAKTGYFSRSKKPNNLWHRSPPNPPVYPLSIPFFCICPLFCVCVCARARARAYLHFGGVHNAKILCGCSHVRKGDGPSGTWQLQEGRPSTGREAAPPMMSLMTSWRSTRLTRFPSRAMTSITFSPYSVLSPIPNNGPRLRLPSLDFQSGPKQGADFKNKIIVNIMVMMMMIMNPTII
jgi:hypothetical protein